MSAHVQRCLSLFGVSLALFVVGWGRPAEAQIRVIDDGPVNEGFVPPVTDATALDAIEHEPPPEITERIPPKPNSDVVWVKGYWFWDEDRGDEGDWVWCGGAWRRPPPGRHWVDGFWREYDAGWVRINGFWSPVPADDVTYIEDPPPEPLDEEPGNPPGRGFFWHPGYWEYSSQRGYFARHGKWEQLDPNWVLVPAHYVWRPDGYVFLNAYWDFPIERRGAVYKSIYVERPARVAVVYEPVVIVEPTAVVSWCYYSYPNYTYVLHHHYHHHHAWWHDHHDVPAWWGWDSWWGLRWHDHWGVWWWYTHPGYPHPHFLTSSHAALIHAPSQTTIINVRNVVRRPVIVTNNGVISSGQSIQIAARGRVKIKDGADGGKKDKSAPALFVKDTKAKAADVATKTAEKKVKEDPKVATALLPTGKKKAKPDDDEDDPKKHPTKPKSAFGSDALARPGAPTKGAVKATTKAKDGRDRDDEKAKSSTPPIRTKDGTKDGRDDEKAKSKSSAPPGRTKDGTKDDRDDEKPKSKSSSPPVRSKDEKSDRPKDKDSEKPKTKESDKPKGKSDDRPAEKSKGPTTPTGGERSKEKGGDTLKDRPGDKSGDKSGDKPKDKAGDRPAEKSKGGPPAGTSGGERAKEKAGAVGEKKKEKDEKKKDRN